MTQQKAPITSAELLAKKTDAQSRLHLLRMSQVDALGRGEDIPNSNEILIVKEELNALDEAIVRAEAREEEEKRRADIRRTRELARSYVVALEELDGKRLAHLAKVEAAARLLVTEIQAYQEISEKTSSECWDATRFYNSQPSSLRRVKHITFRREDLRSLDTSAVRDRLGGYLSAAFAALVNGAGRFGPMHWDLLPAIDGPWATIEKRLGGGDIYQLLKPNLEHIVESIPAEPAGE